MKKTIAAIAAVLMFALALTACGKSADSRIYAQEDIDSAIAVATAEFDTWKGAELKSIAFTDDATCEADLDYCNSLRANGIPAFTQAIVLTSDIHSLSEAEVQGTAWLPNRDYSDWTWHLARTDGGEWQLLTWGY